MVGWKGPLRGLQKMALYWDWACDEKPCVVLQQPKLYPREGATFDQIPHLMFNSERPELPGLCLFESRRHGVVE